MVNGSEIGYYGSREWVDGECWSAGVGGTITSAGVEGREWKEGYGVCLATTGGGWCKYMHVLEWLDICLRLPSLNDMESCLPALPEGH